MKFTSKTLLFLIFLLAFILRFYNLSLVPVGLHVDEINAGYVGRYIFLHGGKDMFGHFLPLYYNKFGDFRPTGIFYLSGLSTFLFGLNAFAIRFPSALFGALSVIPLYFLSLKLLGNKKAALFSSIFLALMPWHIVLSRATSESIIGLFFFLWGLNFMFDFLKSNTRRDFVLSVILLLIPYFFYHNFRLLIPFFMLYFLAFNFRSKLRKQLFASLLFFGIITVGLLFTASGTGRFSQVAFYKNPGVKDTVNTLLKQEGLSQNSRFFINKPVFYSREFLRGYASYFSSDFLFFKGGLPDRYTVPETGLLPIVWAVFLAFGFIALSWDSKQRRNFIFLSLFLLFAPLAAALTYEDAPNVQRSILMIVPLSIFAGYGLSQMFNPNRKIMFPLMAIVLLFAVFEQSYFWHQYTVGTQNYKLYSRSEGERALTTALLSRRGQFKTIIASIYQELPQFLLFYANDFSAEHAKVFTPNLAEYNLDGILFINAGCPSHELSRFNISDPHPLIADNMACDFNPSGQFGQVGFVTYRNGDKAYRLLTY